MHGGLRTAPDEPIQLSRFLKTRKKARSLETEINKHNLITIHQKIGTLSIRSQVTSSVKPSEGIKNQTGVTGLCRPTVNKPITEESIDHHTRLTLLTRQDRIGRCKAHGFHLLELMERSDRITAAKKGKHPLPTSTIPGARNLEHKHPVGIRLNPGTQGPAIVTKHPGESHFTLFND